MTFWLGQSLDVPGLDIPFWGDIDTVVLTMNMGWRVGYQRQSSSYCYLAPLLCPYSSILSWSPDSIHQKLPQPLSGFWCRECQTIVRNFENPFSIRFRFVHVFADILCLRWNLSATVPGQLKLYSMFRAFTRKLLLVGKSNQPRFSYRTFIFPVYCVFRKVRVMSDWYTAAHLLPRIYWFICNLDNDITALCCSGDFHCSCAAWTQLAVKYADQWLSC